MLDTTLKGQIEFMEHSIETFKNPLSISILNSLKELKGIKEKQILHITKKPSSEWIKEVGYEIIDPDGWDRFDFDYSFNIEKITQEEFMRRLMLSTVKRVLK
jgi:hypothetical protein